MKEEALLLLTLITSMCIELKMAASLVISPSSAPPQFSVQKARLMARFSSVAYEDPPLAMQRLFDENYQIGKIDSADSCSSVGFATAKFNGVERFVDDFGVTITRPAKTGQVRSLIASADDENIWKMAHIDAYSPRPLGLMISDCVPSPSVPADFDAEKASFQWVALASSKKAQFDAWNITTNSNSVDGNTKNILVIAFRGTRLNTSVDLLTDIQLQQKMVSCSDFVCKLNGEESDDPSPYGVSSRSDEDIMVHSGFLKAYASVRSTPLQLISDSSNIDEIWMTGHSLGGALATLAVIDAGSIMKQQSSVSATTVTGNDLTLTVPWSKISSYVFGTPRVGNSALGQRLNKLQQSNHENSSVGEYFRVNAAGDAIPFLPRGKRVNRLDIDYMHAGTTVVLPSVFNTQSQSTTKETRSIKSMMQLEEELVERINNYVFKSKSMRDDDRNKKADFVNKLRVYYDSDLAPDPLTEIDPEYSGFFPTSPLIWVSKSFRKFVLGESVRSFRILRGGFNREHRLANYEKILCAVSQENVIVIT